MGRFIDESVYTDKIIKDIDSKLDNPKYSRYITNGPATFVTYYNINNAESTVDSGLYTTESMYGGKEKSPIRFTEIKKFPLYELQKIQIQKAEEEYGTQVSYDGTATILPATIMPMPGDAFLLQNSSHQTMLMQITDFEYNTVKSKTYYSITFRLKYTGEEYLEGLNSQVSRRTTFVPDGSGSAGEVIQDDTIAKMSTLSKTFEMVKNTFMRSFYVEQFNSFVCQDRVFSEPTKEPGDIAVNSKPTHIYDRLMNGFIQKNNYFNDKKSYKTLYLTNEDECPDYELDYADSIWYCLETQSIETIQGYYKAQLINYTDMHSSIFNFYDRQQVLFVRTVEPYVSACYINIDYLSPEFTERLAVSSSTYTDVRHQIISDYLWKEVNSVDEIPYDIYNKLRLRSRNREDMILTAMSLFVLNTYLTSFK